jgi:hypothetical protein
VKTRKLSSRSSRRRGYGGAVAYLRVENPRFLFLGGSADVVAAAGVATASPPVVPAARVASLIGCLAAGAPAPALGAVSSAASAALGEAKAPTSREESVPHRSPPRPTTSTRKSPGRRVPAARAAETPHSSVPGAPVAGSSSPSCTPPGPAPAATPRARAHGLGAWAGRTARRSRSRAAGNKRKVRPRLRVAREWRGRRRKLYSPAGPRGA